MKAYTQSWAALSGLFVLSATAFGQVAPQAIPDREIFIRPRNTGGSTITFRAEAVSSYVWDNSVQGYMGKIGRVDRLNTSNQKEVTLREVIVPRRFALRSPYPNPFNSSTSIPYTVSTPADATIGIFDISGRLVTVLVDRHEMEGIYRVLWDGRTKDGNIVPSGVYLIRFSTTKTKGEHHVFASKVILIR